MTGQHKDRNCPFPESNGVNIGAAIVRLGAGAIIWLTAIISITYAIQATIN
jgi:hypothetical protein